MSSLSPLRAPRRDPREPVGSVQSYADAEDQRGLFRCSTKVDDLRIKSTVMGLGTLTKLK